MLGSASKENGKLGGRPKGSKANHTIQAEAAKAALIQAYLENIIPINQALVKKAKAGDIQAIKEIHDRAWGKPNQDITSKGERLIPIPILGSETISKENDEQPPVSQ